MSPIKQAIMKSPVWRVWRVRDGSVTWYLAYRHGNSAIPHNIVDLDATPKMEALPADSPLAAFMPDCPITMVVQTGSDNFFAHGMTPGTAVTKDAAIRENLSASKLPFATHATLTDLAEGRGTVYRYTGEVTRAQHARLVAIHSGAWVSKYGIVAIFGQHDANKLAEIGFLTEDAHRKAQVAAFVARKKASGQWEERTKEREPRPERTPQRPNVIEVTRLDGREMAPTKRQALMMVIGDKLFNEANIKMLQSRQPTVLRVAVSNEIAQQWSRSQAVGMWGFELLVPGRDGPGPV
jgi:hypothetical protein